MIDRNRISLLWTAGSVTASFLMSASTISFNFPLCNECLVTLISFRLAALVSQGVSFYNPSTAFNATACQVLPLLYSQITPLTNIF